MHFFRRSTQNQRKGSTCEVNMNFCCLPHGSYDFTLNLQNNCCMQLYKTVQICFNLSVSKFNSNSAMNLYRSKIRALFL